MCILKICVTNRNGDSWVYFECKSVYWLGAMCHFQLHVGEESLRNDAAPCCWPKGNANINFISCWCSKIDLSCHIMAVKNDWYTQAHIHWEMDRNMERSLIDVQILHCYHCSASRQGTVRDLLHPVSVKAGVKILLEAWIRLCSPSVRVEEKIDTICMSVRACVCVCECQRQKAAEHAVLSIDKTIERLCAVLNSPARSAVQSMSCEKEQEYALNEGDGDRFDCTCWFFIISTLVQIKQQVATILSIFYLLF